MWTRFGVRIYSSLVIKASDSSINHRIATLSRKFYFSVSEVFTVSKMQFQNMQMQEAKQLHAHIITAGLVQHQQELYLQKLITFFAISNPSSLNYARLVFDHIESPSTVMYNTMIRAYTTSSDSLQAIHLYNEMHKQGSPPDKYTFPFLLKACSSLSELRKGEETHCRAVKLGFDTDIFVQNSLIHLYGSNAKINLARRIFNEMDYRDIATWTTLVSCYANFASLETARQLFDKMPKRSVVSFSALVAGYVRRGRFTEALALFHDMQIAEMEPNDSTISSVLSACANIGALDMGRWIHSYIQDRKLNKFDSRIRTGLIDMYVKCGSIKNALYVFAESKEKQVGEWTAMISGMAMNGLGERGIELFEEMVGTGVKPNVVTFVALLSGCTHSGMVNKGLSYFERMEAEFGIKPTIEHFGCVVDLLGRAGLINQAIKFIQGMPVEANAAIWGALLNACKIHKNVEVGELAAKWLINEEPWNGALYMTLLDLYKEAGRWDDVEKVKWEMKEVGSKKSPGCSLIEVNGVCYEFVVEDKSHPCALQLCLNLGELVMEVKENRWVFS